MQTLCDKNLEGIIHKPMPRHAGLSVESGGGDAHPEMGAVALGVGPRVARVRGVPVDQVNALIARHTEAPLGGFLGEPRVNVLALNLALDGAR